MTGLIANGWFWAGVGGAVFAAGLWLTARYGGTGKGTHVAPRGWAEADERTALPYEMRVIKPAEVDGHPPWDDQPPPDGYFIAAGTVEDGRLTSVRAAVVPALPQPVAALLGHDTVDAALDSIFTRAMSREVRALTDGAS